MNLIKYQKENIIVINHHFQNIITLDNLIEQFSNYISKDSYYIESNECNPPFIITNKSNEELLVKSNIDEMVKHFHLNYQDE